MRTLKMMVLVMAMSTMFMFGGFITDGVQADEATSEEVVVEDVIEEDVVEEEVVEEEVETYDGDEIEDVDGEDDTPQGIIESQTGLYVDYIKWIEGNGSWDAWYVEADGDIYAITIKDGIVDVVAQLN